MSNVEKGWKSFLAPRLLPQGLVTCCTHGEANEHTAHKQSCMTRVAATALKGQAVRFSAKASYYMK